MTALVDWCISNYNFVNAVHLVTQCKRLLLQEYDSEAVKRCWSETVQRLVLSTAPAVTTCVLWLQP